LLLQQNNTLFATWIRVPETLEVTVGTLVAEIAPKVSGTEVWDVSVFPSQPYTEPYSATVNVDIDTLVDESRAIARPGQWADVLAEPLEPDEFQAEVIRLEQTVTVTLEADLPQSVAASEAGGWAQIGGRTVWFPDQMAARISAASGRQGKTLIERILLGNGVVLAQRCVTIESQAP
jgi:hypothetical protein